MTERKIVKYKTVSNNNPRSVDEQVTKLLEEGWELHGSQNNTSRFFSQVLVQYIDTDLAHLLEGYERLAR